MPTPYKTTRFSRGQIPNGLCTEHRLKPGVHAELRVLEGRLVFVDANGRRSLQTGDVHRIPPDAPHHLEDADDAAIELTFLR